MPVIRWKDVIVVTVVRWTGREARALRDALRMSARDFAAHANISAASIADMEAKGERTNLRHSTQRILDGALATASAEVQQRFSDLLHVRSAEASAGRPPLAPAAEFLGSDTVVICAPIRREEVRARPVIAVADNAAAQTVGEVARTVGLRPVFELIPDSGEVDLNRPDLVVICGPRMSTAVARVLSQDPLHKFLKADDGPWTLRDGVGDVVYRSGQDQHPARPWDAAYLGRLPRPDGSGSLLLIAGIHPQGSLGAAKLISTRLADLHRDTGSGCFSVLVGAEYDPISEEPCRVGLLTPLNRWDGVRTNAGIDRDGAGTRS